MPQAAIYARKSSESDDRQVLSLDSQIAWAREVCVKLKIPSPLILEEKQSAKTPGRPAFAQLMALIQAGKIDTVLCWKADRLARNALDGGAILYALESKRLMQIVTADRTYTRDADSELMLHMELGLSAKYSKDLSKNIRRGIAEKLRRGEWNGRAPLGYSNIRESTDHGRIVMDPEMAPRVRELFEIVAGGNVSLSALAGITRTDWKLVSPKRRNLNATGLSVSTLQRLLRNPIYYGALRVNGALHAGSHAPLITRDLFERVQCALTGRRATAERPKRKSFCFAGLMRCGLCGRRLSGYLRVKPSGRQYTYYVCTKHIRRLCALPPVAEGDAVSEVRVMLRRLSLDTRGLAHAEKMLAGIVARREGTAAAEGERIAARLSDLHRQQARLLDLLVAGTIPDSDYETKRRDLASAEAELTLMARAAEASATEKLEPARAFFRALVDLTGVFERCSADERRDLLRNVGLELEATADRVLVHAGKPATVMLRRGGRPVTWRVAEDVMNSMASESDSSCGRSIPNM